jgi:hypothetical protein
MIPLTDSTVRLALLHHLAADFPISLIEAPTGRASTARVLRSLGPLSAADLKRLSAMNDLRIRVDLDHESLDAGLRLLQRINEARELEAYFVRHGASAPLIRRLFKTRREEVYRRRRESDTRIPKGTPSLPIYEIRQRVPRRWLALDDLPLRERYRQLHQEFPSYPIRVLERIVALVDART